MDSSLTYLSDLSMRVGCHWLSLWMFNCCQRACSDCGGGCLESRWFAEVVVKSSAGFEILSYFGPFRTRFRLFVAQVTIAACLLYSSWDVSRSCGGVASLAPEFAGWLQNGGCCRCCSLRCSLPATHSTSAVRSTNSDCNSIALFSPADSMRKSQLGLYYYSFSSSLTESFIRYGTVSLSSGVLCSLLEDLGQVGSFLLMLATSGGQLEHGRRRGCSGSVRSVPSSFGLLAMGISVTVYSC